MPMELRKRKAPAAPSVQAPAAKKKASATARGTGRMTPRNVISAPAKPAKGKAATKVNGTASKTEEKAEEKKAEEKKAEEKKVEEKKVEVKAAPAALPQEGETVDLEGFGGEVLMNDGKTTTLKELVGESKAGVVLFTYPRASTPGCTKQVCFFRDSYTHLTKTGLLIFGLSADSTKANTTFKEKQKLTYPLLCDTSRSLISAIGLKKAPSGTQRGVFVVDKSGKVLAAQAGGPQATVDIVKGLIEEK